MTVGVLEFVSYYELPPAPLEALFPFVCCSKLFADPLGPVEFFILLFFGTKPGLLSSFLLLSFSSSFGPPSLLLLPLLEPPIPFSFIAPPYLPFILME